MEILNFLNDFGGLFSRTDHYFYTIKESRKWLKMEGNSINSPMYRTLRYAIIDFRNRKQYLEDGEREKMIYITGDIHGEVFRIAEAIKDSRLQTKIQS